MVRSGTSARFSDAALAIFVIAIAVMLLIPLPTLALDLLLALSIAFSVLLLLVGLYIPNALSLLAFPSLLLLTTLFRLSLNVASTRLILSDGDAGTVIEAFGTFLIRGEVVVGIIIFVIVTVVNFIVIARGAGRVSEVAARFALDALPGKQMAIDSDLRAGIINAQEAQQKRELLRQESQLYGAMDGAMKFVQGDAVAGLFITCTNIVGGMYMGLAQGMSVEQAIKTYTTLTVGDGLVSQIPALLVSICAGIVVTRVAASDRSTLGRELGAQLFKRPILLVLTGVILLVVMALSELPWLPFLTIVLACFAAAYYVSKNSQTNVVEYGARVDGFPTRALGVPQDSYERTHAGQTIELVLDQAVLFKLYERKATPYHEWWRRFQRDFFARTGLEMPEMVVSADPYLASGSYHVRLGDASIERGGVLLDSVMVEMNPHCAKVFGLRVLRKEEHPLRGEQVFWTRASLSSLEILRAADICYHDFFEYIALRVGRYLQSNPEEVLSLIDIHAK
ncbi:MAG: FHIPEP family type III secretion protein, partial [Bdellovibrionales bacterium]|nr:FHIPEP family type III secretion protein [Bdellovibrionales bacterium]